jgi:hypothetical protein
VIIHKVNIGCLAMLEPKNNPPVGAHSHSPKAFELALQGVEAERWQPQRIDRFRRMQHAQNLPKLTHVLGVYALCRVVLEKLPQSLMPKALDYVSPIVM